ncbi:hypothetical protein BJ170DRAFT_594516 [Xylariales sp. AK1849]|nr:hypothetical protein BJ170DRAFT_594516 [Xylariales sp. AK1849]
MPYQGSSPCEDGSLTKLSSSTLKVIRGDIGIEAVETLKEVSFPVLQDAASIYINNLTALDTLDLEMLDTGRNLTVTEVPQLLYLNLGVSKGDRVIIAGNGSLVLALDNFSLRDNPRLEVLTISGVEEVRWISTNGQGTIGNLTVHDSKVDQLPLFFGNIESLEIRDNDELTDVLFPPDDIARKQIVSKMKNIAVSGNKKLNLTTIHDVNWNNVHDLSSWVWPMENMDTVVLDGIIHDAFLWVSSVPLCPLAPYRTLSSSSTLSSPRHDNGNTADVVTLLASLSSIPTYTRASPRRIQVNRAYSRTFKSHPQSRHFTASHLTS